MIDVRELRVCEQGCGEKRKAMNCQLARYSEELMAIGAVSRRENFKDLTNSLPGLSQLVVSSHLGSANYYLLFTNYFNA
jgi:hypothetical protein